MEWVVGPTEIVKLFGGPVVRYLKYQIKYNDYLRNFNESKVRLGRRKHDIELRRQTQLQSAPCNVVRAEVEEWLKDANDFMARQDVEEEVSRWRCLSCCCRAVILEERTQELKAIYDRGDKYTTEDLVVEDQSKKLNYYVEKFKEFKEKLQHKLGTTGLTLQSQLVYGKIEREDVKHWREKVEEIIGPIAQVIEDKIGGCLSHSSDWLVRLLGEKIQEMERICEEGSRLPECLVINDPSAWAVELLTEELQGSEAVKANILAWLRGEEVAKLGVWGMGGVGKTTIMKHVHNELLKEGEFKKIIWVSVSQNFDIHKLQEQIACSLKEKLEELQNATNRAAVLSKMLEKQKPYLLILDDVWNIFEFEDVGIPESHVADGCKLVLTTRSQEIARSMGCKRIKVETLSQEEALKLFLNKVGDTVLSDHGGGIKNDLESTLKKIVDECDGLPLAIVTVAGSLKETSEPWLWSVALNQLRDCKRNVAGTDDDDAFRILKFSYDRLKNPKIQYCFLYCALYPEDYNILKEQIIEYWIDEGFIDEMETRHAMKDEGHHVLRRLEDNSLLEFIKAEDEDEEDCVRMHDLVRDMALDITRKSPRFLVEAGKALRELPEKVKCTEDVEKVSLMFNYMREIPSSMASSTCRRLTTLLLAHNGLSTIPESVFEHIPELKVLDLSFNRLLGSLPNSFSKLVNLTTLLLESTSLDKVPSLSGLRSMKRLNLRDTKIKEVTEGLRMLTNLKCLALCGSFLNALEINEIADGVLSNLSKIQELIVDRSRIKLKGEVVGRLMKLEVFHGLFPTVNEMRIFLKCQPNRRLSSYFITVGSKSESDDPDMIDDTVGSKSESDALDTVDDTVGSKSESDALDMVDDTVGSKSESDDPDMIDDTVGSKSESDALDTVDDTVGSKSESDGSKSESDAVDIINEAITMLPRCKKIMVFNETSGIVGENVLFPSVQLLVVKACQDVRSLNDFSAIKDEMVTDLRGCSIENCDGMEWVLCSWINNPIVQTLEYLDLRSLQKLDGLFEAKVIAKSLPPCTPFSSLKTIHIESCHKIKKLFPSWKLVEYLQSLQSIGVRNCKEMEEIISSDPEEEGEEGGDIIKKLILPKLKGLTLQNLRALKSICGDRRTVMACDSLEWVDISNCKGLRGIFVYLPSPPYLFVSDLDKLDGLFEAQVIAPNSPPPPTPFSSLKTITIERCHKIKKLFPSWKLVEYLPSLERIDVDNCEEMEEIIASDDPEEEGEEGGAIIKQLILPKLKTLALRSLPALRSICSGKRAVMACDSLETIYISSCRGIKGIFVYHPSPPYLFVSDLDKLDGLFEAQVIAPNSPPPPTAFSSLKRVRIDRCPKIKKLFPSWKLVEYLQSLEYIEVRGCEEMEEIIASDPEEGGDIMKKLTLPKLKQLELKDLRALKSICSGKRAVMACDSLENIEISYCGGIRGIFVYHPSPPYLFVSDLDKLDGLFEAQVIAPNSPPPPTAFSSLKRVRIDRCPKIKKLFPSWKLVEYLQSLEYIEVRGCEEMEEIIAIEEEGEEGGDIMKKLTLPKLKQLELKNLRALKSICSGKRAVMACDSLESIDISDCGGLRRIFVNLPSGPYLFVSDLDKLDGLFEAQVIAPNSPPPPTAFSSLQIVRIDRCPKIKKLFPSWKLVEYLQSLEYIEVRGCEEMEEIIASDPEEEGEEGRDIIKKRILPKLKELTLWDLPALKSICSWRRAVMACDSLNYIKIRDCKGLRRIPIYLPLLHNAQPSPPPSLKKIHLDPDSEEWWESLEWDHPNAKDVLRPMVEFSLYRYMSPSTGYRTYLLHKVLVSVHNAQLVRKWNVNHSAIL